MNYPIKRELDGIFIRVMRDGKPDNVCFSDMTAAERDEWMASRDETALRRTCQLLADLVHGMGDKFDIAIRRGEDD
jgi:hypothetical protein